MSLTLRRVTAVVGAEISGVYLRRPLTDEARDAIQAALVEHGVLFFRDQDVTPEQHLDFARRMGPISIPAFAP